ncbi:MAG: carboxymuconolactone decarboxylase family protein [Burkholderiales bacterium]
MDSHARVDYPQFNEIAPGVGAALRALAQAVVDSGLEKTLTELIKVRASQLNGCAFCVQYHLNAARRLGVDARKLDLAAVWRDAGVFDARERAALAWTETLTRLDGADGAPDADYERMRAHFSTAEAVNLTAAIANINAWNRIAVGLRFTPPAPA